MPAGWSVTPWKWVCSTIRIIGVVKEICEDIKQQVLDECLRKNQPSDVLEEEVKKTEEIKGVKLS